MAQTKRKSGLAFHCHHDCLIEYVYDYNERVRFIKSDKPQEEQELRLRLFKLIPLRKLLPVIRKADAEWEKAYAEREPQLEKLHQKLCPDCPWDGKTIFSAK